MKLRFAQFQFSPFSMRQNTKPKTENPRKMGFPVGLGMDARSLIHLLFPVSCKHGTVRLGLLLPAWPDSRNGPPHKAGRQRLRMRACIHDKTPRAFEPPKGTCGAGTPGPPLAHIYCGITVYIRWFPVPGELGNLWQQPHGFLFRVSGFQFRRNWKACAGRHMIFGAIKPFPPARAARHGPKGSPPRCWPNASRRDSPPRRSQPPRPPA